jgi:hypothetical protein
MSQQHIELRGSCAFELQRVDRVLSELARPALHENSMAPSTLAAVAQLGIGAGDDLSRKELIERLWGRKRTLLRQMSSLGDWGPMRPVA